MKKTKKKGERDIRLGSQERSILISVLFNWQEANKKEFKTNRIIRRENSYVEKVLGKLTRKTRCKHCGNWI